MSKYYVIDTDVTLSEKVDQDTVVINLNTGCYYNFNPTASYIWEMMSSGFSETEIIGQYSDVFTLSREDSESEVSGIIDIIISGELARFAKEKPSVNEIPKTNPGYIQAEIEKFDDMQEMLLLDPIHEVTEKGWPHKNDDQ